MALSVSEKATAHFISFVGPNYSRSSTLLNFKSNHIDKTYTQVSPQIRKMIPELIQLRKKVKYRSVIVVMSPCHKITFFAKLILRKEVILDAGWPLSDGVFSRGQIQNKIPHLVKILLIDFISFQISDLVLVESQAQLDRIHRNFAISKSKIQVSLTGVNEAEFENVDKVSSVFKSIENKLKSNSPLLTVLFRGRINKESGIDLIISAANALEDVANFVLVTSANSKLKNLPKNCYVLSNLNGFEMKRIYELSDVALGQVSSHARLYYTIPHKAFEAGYFGKSYISPASGGLLELYSSNAFYALPKASIEELISSIRALQSIKIRNKLEKNIKKEYLTNSSQSRINNLFDSIVESVTQSKRHL